MNVASLKHRISPILYEFRTQALTETFRQFKSLAISGERNSVSQAVVDCGATRATAQMGKDLLS